MLTKPTWPKNPFLFLVHHEYGQIETTNPVRAALSYDQLPPIPPKNREAAKAFLKELNNLPVKAINARVQILIDEQNRRATEQLRDSDALRFFSQPHANAMYEEWVGLRFWKTAEAASLSFGKCPNVVNPETMEPFRKSSLFAQEYFSRIELIKRDLSNESYFEKIGPVEFLAWLKRNTISFPAALEQAMIEKSDPTDSEHQMGVQQKLLGVRERDSLLYMIATMAIKKYGYSPTKKNTAASKIVADMAKMNVPPLSAETVRNKLKEASELVPRGIFKDQE